MGIFWLYLRYFWPMVEDEYPRQRDANSLFFSITSVLLRPGSWHLPEDNHITTVIAYPSAWKAVDTDTPASRITALKPWLSRSLLTNLNITYLLFLFIFIPSSVVFLIRISQLSTLELEFYTNILGNLLCSFTSLFHLICYLYLCLHLFLHLLFRILIWLWHISKLQGWQRYLEQEHRRLQRLEEKLARLQMQMRADRVYDSAIQQGIHHELGTGSRMKIVLDQIQSKHCETLADAAVLDHVNAQQERDYMWQRRRWRGQRVMLAGVEWGIRGMVGVVGVWLALVGRNKMMMMW